MTCWQGSLLFHFAVMVLVAAWASVQPFRGWSVLLMAA